jgi:hypothetical protein
MTRRHFGGLAASVGFVALVLTQSSLFAQVAPNLGTAQQFGALGDSGVTGSTGSGTVVSGDVGSYPTGSITNFPPSSVGAGFTLHTAANATVQQAQTDARAAYDALAAQGGTTLNDNLSTNGTIGPGVYALGAADLPASTTLTLDGSGIFIFNVASTLTMNGSSVVAGTADPCNVYWRVGTSATLNGTSFLGTVIADASITLGGGNVTGRLLAGTGATGAVTMASGGNTIGGCSQALVVPTITKAFSPTSIAAGGVSRLTITLSNANASLISLTAALTDTLPAGVLVAATPTASTTCSGTVTATAGSSTVSLATGSTIPAAGSCTVSVNVTAAAAGSYVNTVAVGALQTSGGDNTVAATATLTATACPVITLAPATLPDGTIGVAWSQTVTASGGTAPYSFTVASGTLPAGVALTTAGGLGLLSGTPTAAGTSTFTIRGTDANGCFAEIVYTQTISAVPPVPTMSQWAIIALGALLLLGGALVVRSQF